MIVAVTIVGAVPVSALAGKNRQKQAPRSPLRRSLGSYISPRRRRRSSPSAGASQRTLGHAAAGSRLSAPPAPCGTGQFAGPGSDPMTARSRRCVDGGRAQPRGHLHGRRPLQLPPPGLAAAPVASGHVPLRPSRTGGRAGVSLLSLPSANPEHTCRAAR